MLFLALTLALAASLAPDPNAPVSGGATDGDNYTRYELLAPGSAKFRILYEVTATRAGAMVFDNPIRRGSVATDERVFDVATGKPLAHATISAEAAKADGVRGNAADEYLQVKLARPVPADGGQRILIDKTYEDAKSCAVEPNGDLVFTRPLGIRRNSVILPSGYELVSSTFPSQVLQQPDGRIGISFWNSTPSEAAVTIRARKAATPLPPRTASSAKIGDRAHQTRDIVYFLQAPETHAFRLYHDYVETKAGVDDYVNVVRTGSVVREPSARDLDTGEALRFEVLKGEAIVRAGIKEPGLVVTPDAEVVVFRFPAVPAGGSKRIRMSETYVDAERYTVTDGELVWRRSFGRAHNAVVLPAGWALTASSVPCTVSELKDGRARLDFTNPRLDEIDTTILAHRR